MLSYTEPYFFHLFIHLRSDQPQGLQTHQQQLVSLAFVLGSIVGPKLLIA